MTAFSLKRVLVGLALATAVLATGYTFTFNGASAVASPTQAGSALGTRVSAPGRVIGKSETIELAFPVAGRIDAIPVTAGQPVDVGEVLAKLDCDPQQARAATAQVESEAAKHRFMRMQQLHRRAGAVAISDTELEGASDAALVAEARSAEARAQLAWAGASSRSEDVDAAKAEVDSQSERMSAANASLAQCTLRSPIKGTVLKVLRDAGETVSGIEPETVLALADLSERRVRVEVDERDVASVRVGQGVLIVGDANSTLRARGAVTRIDAQMGRRRTRTLDPADKSDRDVLEVIVDVGETLQVLPLDYRVTAIFD